MKRLIAIAGVAMLLLAGAAGPAVAGPFQPERVASTAKWVAHLDVEAAGNSQAVQFLLQQPGPAAKLAKAVKECQDKAGFDPTKDLKSVTLYGTEYDEQAGVAVVQVKVDRDKVLAALAASEGHKEVAYGDVTIHQWTDKRRGNARTGYGCFVGDDLIVIAGSLEGAKLAVDVLAGKKDNVTKGPLAAILPKPSPGSVLLAAGQDLVVPPKAPPRAALLRKLQSLSIDAGESQGRCYVNIVGQAKDDKDASRVRTILNGLLAAAALAGDADSPLVETDSPLGCLVTLANGIKVGGEDKAVVVTGNWDVETVKKVAAKAIELKAKATERAKAADEGLAH